MPTYKCTACGATAQVPSSIPGATFREKDLGPVLAFRPFTASCGKCSAAVLAPVPAVYIGENFAVRLTPAGFAPMEDVPPPGSLRILRDTTDVLAFREKVLLLTAGIDDRAVELLKVITMKSNEDTGLQDLLVLDLDDEALHLSGVNRNGEDILYGSPLELYENVLAQIPQDGSWDTNGYAAVDVHWIRSRVRAIS